jgi:hypothetical protein
VTELLAVRSSRIARVGDDAFRELSQREHAGTGARGADRFFALLAGLELTRTERRFTPSPRQLRLTRNMYQVGT